MAERYYQVGVSRSATVTAQLSVDIVNQLVNRITPGEPILPLGYSIRYGSLAQIVEYINASAASTLLHH